MNKHSVRDFPLSINPSGFSPPYVAAYNPTLRAGFFDSHPISEQGGFTAQKVNEMNEQPQGITDLDKWGLAQVIAGREVDPGLPFSQQIWPVLSELSSVAHNWRAQLLTAKVGQFISAEVARIDPSAPMPKLPVNGAAPQTQKPANLINANDLEKLVRPMYALEEYAIYMTGMNALVGPSGAGKSFVALDIAALLTTRGLPAVYVAAEGVSGYAGRWKAWKQQNGLKTDLLQFYTRPVNLIDGNDTHKFITEISPYSPKMIVIDTVARCMAGGDENSTRDMSLFIGMCDEITQQTKAALLLVHHTGKDGKMRGSTALYAACDSVLFLERSDSDIRVYNSFDKGGKNKHNQEAAERRLTIIPKEVEIEGELYSSAVLVESSHVMQSPDDKLSPNQSDLLEALAGYPEGIIGGELEKMVDINRATIYRNLKLLIKSGLVAKFDQNYCLTPSGMSRTTF